MDVLDRFSFNRPVMQAGMADISRSALPAAVSRAGGIATVGLSPPVQFEIDILDTKEKLDGEPFAVNLLMPFVVEDHVGACLRNKVPIATLFFGIDKQLMQALQSNRTNVLVQVGGLSEAIEAMRVSADGLIVQGTEAGGHIRGHSTLKNLSPKIREHFRDTPIFAAGGIHDRATSRKAIDLGADAVACGTRFLMTPECFAHDEYKQRLIDANTTILTTLFGVGWPDKHRVIPNGATQR